MLIVAEALLIFGAVVAAAHLRLGWVDSYYELNERHGFEKAALFTSFCLAAFYLYDLYDFVVMHDRRELVLRLIQALGLAWIALAILIYALPQLMIGRGVSLIALPLALFLMVAWRVAIHWLLGHPNVGERILIVGSGSTAIEIAREVLERRDAGYRIVGFVDNTPELVGRASSTRASSASAPRWPRSSGARASTASSSRWASGAGSSPPNTARPRLSGDVGD